VLAARHVHRANQCARLRVRFFLSTATTSLLSHGCCSPISSANATQNSGLCHYLGLPRGGVRLYHDQSRQPVIHRNHELIFSLLLLLRIKNNIIIQAGCGRAMSLFLHLLATSCQHISPARADLMGSELYDSLAQYFVQHLQHLRDVSCFAHDDGIAIDPSYSTRIHYKTSLS